MIEKIKSSSSSTTNGQRIAETSERAKMQKRQKCRKKKERKKERKRERRKRRRRRRRNGDASSWSASISPWLRSFNNGCKG